MGGEGRICLTLLVRHGGTTSQGMQRGREAAVACTSGVSALDTIRFEEARFQGGDTLNQFVSTGSRQRVGHDLGFPSESKLSKSTVRMAACVS